MCNMKMNFICSEGPLTSNFCRAIRTRFRIQKFRIPFTPNNFDYVSQNLFLARLKDTYSLTPHFEIAWLI